MPQQRIRQGVEKADRAGIQQPVPYKRTLFYVMLYNIIPVALDQIPPEPRLVALVPPVRILGLGVPRLLNTSQPIAAVRFDGEPRRPVGMREVHVSPGVILLHQQAPSCPPPFGPERTGAPERFCHFS